MQEDFFVRERKNFNFLFEILTTVAGWGLAGYKLFARYVSFTILLGASRDPVSNVGGVANVVGASDASCDTKVDDKKYAEIPIETKPHERICETMSPALRSVHPGLQHQIIIGDGDCLYRAVTYYLSFGEDVEFLRKKVAENLERHADQYGGFAILSEGQSLSEYVKKIKDTKEWAGHLEINLLMLLLSRPIAVIGPEGTIRNIDEVERYMDKGEPIFVYYNGIDHYDAFILRYGYDSRTILTEIMNPISGRDMPFLHWFQPLKRLVKMIRDSRESIDRLRLFYCAVESRDYLVSIQLLSDYLAFQDRLLANRPNVHLAPLSEKEKCALHLYSHQAELHTYERDEFVRLLRDLYVEEVQERKVMYDRANSIYHVFKKSPVFNVDLQCQILDYICLELRVSKDKLSIQDHSVAEIVASKLLLEHIDRDVEAIQQVSYLIAAYRELKRLQKKIECFVGEDFLREKVRQLEWLFENCRKMSWNIVIVDDQESISEDGVAVVRTIDQIGRLIAGDDDGGLLNRNKNRIVLLDYGKDLNEERASYSDERIRKLSADEFARVSSKGGAIQTGLRYIAHVAGEGKQYRVPKSDVVMYTDCDLSVNLAASGVLLYAIYVEGNDLVFGSRRLSTSHIVRVESRNAISTMYNLLVSLFMNIPFKDTQAGAKVMRVSFVEKVHSHFTELGMSFDVELIRLAMRNFKVAEKGIVWVDSALESKSGNMGLPMLKGLIRIIGVFYPNVRLQYWIDLLSSNLKQLQVSKADGPELCPDVSGAFDNLARKMVAYPQLVSSLVSLGVNKEWNFCIKYIVQLYQAVAPKEFLVFVGSLQKFIIALSNNDERLTKESVSEIVDSFFLLEATFNPLDGIRFVLEKFSAIKNIVELMMINPRYVMIIVPFLCGSNVVTRLFPIFARRRSFFEYCQNKGVDISSMNAEEAFLLWVRDEYLVTTDKQVLPVEVFVPNRERIVDGIKRIGKAQAHLTAGEVIGVIMPYTMDGTSEVYAKKIITEKVTALREVFGQSNHLKCILYVLDARSQRVSTIGEYINQLIIDVKQDDRNVEIRHLVCSVDCNGKKSLAVRFGLSKAVEDGCSIVGFIDFSNKIDVREIGNLLSGFFERTHLGQYMADVCIGSRRTERSVVANKNPLMIMRSAVLNIMIRLIFPRLAHLSDTQTGFKFFRADVWRSISGYLRCDGIGFDIEILQHAACCGYVIQEFPVDFQDNTLDIEVFIGRDDAKEILRDIFFIRSSIADTSGKRRMGYEAKFIAAGAEHAVYILGTGDVLKIPHITDDADYSAVLANTLFKYRAPMSIEAQGQRVLDSKFMQFLFNSRWLKGYIIKIRNWVEFNCFVMRSIAAFEKKSYKSCGYAIAECYGRDLIVPFRFVREFFVVSIEGRMRGFQEQDKVKQSARVDQLFKHRLIMVLESSVDVSEKLHQIKALLDQGKELFSRLWYRGLFDFDANIMCDTGFFVDSEGRESLMVLDPGEILNEIDDCINIDFARQQIKQRYDYKELQQVLSGYLSPDLVSELLDWHVKNMQEFFDFIERDVQLMLVQHDAREACFARDLRGIEDSRFALKFDPKPLRLPETAAASEDVRSAVASRRNKIRHLHFSSISYMLPYRVDRSMPVLEQLDYTDIPFIHVVPVGTRVGKLQPNEISVAAEIGSIVPTLEAIGDLVFDRDESNLVIVDAGSGNRSSLLKFAQPEFTKGSIMIDGTPLYVTAMRQLLVLVKALPQGYVILSSSDDVLNFSKEDVDRIVSYFNPESSFAPGMFWCDLPNAGRDIFPFTTEDMMRYFYNNKDEIAKHIEAFLLATPFFLNLKESWGDVVGITMNALVNFVMKVQLGSIIESGVEGTKKMTGMHFPGEELLVDFYQQFLVFNGLQRLGGIKTPFLMIFKKNFLREFRERVVPLIPRYAYREDITWVNFLIKGLRADKLVWMKSGKPRLLDDAVWSKIFDLIQELKIKYNIDISSESQNFSRIFSGEWQNFDDPYALFSYIESRSGVPDIILGKNFVMFGDKGSRMNVDQVTIERCDCVKIVLVGCRIEGSLVVKHSLLTSMGGDMTKYVLLYNVILPRDMCLEVLPLHMVVGINGHIYAIAMYPTTKKVLEEQWVYRYNEHGVPIKSCTFKEFARGYGISSIYEHRTTQHFSQELEGRGDTERAAYRGCIGAVDEVSFARFRTLGRLGSKTLNLWFANIKEVDAIKMIIERFKKHEEKIVARVCALCAEEREFFITDCHGDLAVLLFGILGSRVAIFAPGEQAYVYYDVETGCTFKTPSEFLQTYPFIGGCDSYRSCAIDMQISSEAEYVEYRLRLIANLKVNLGSHNVLTLNGDLINRGNQTEECFYTVINLLNQFNGLASSEQPRLYYLCGNKECGFLFARDRDEQDFTMHYPKGSSISHVHFLQAAHVFKTNIAQGKIQFARFLPEVGSGIIQSHTWWSLEDMLALGVVLSGNVGDTEESVVDFLKDKCVGEGSIDLARQELNRLSCVGTVGKIKDGATVAAVVDVINAIFRYPETRSMLPMSREDCSSFRGFRGMLWNSLEPSAFQRLRSNVTQSYMYYELAYYSFFSPRLNESNPALFSQMIGHNIVSRPTNCVTKELLLLDNGCSSGYGFGSQLTLYCVKSDGRVIHLGARSRVDYSQPEHDGAQTHFELLEAQFLEDSDVLPYWSLAEVAKSYARQHCTLL